MKPREFEKCEEVSRYEQSRRREWNWDTLSPCWKEDLWSALPVGYLELVAGAEPRSYCLLSPSWERARVRGCQSLQFHPHLNPLPLRERNANLAIDTFTPSLRGAQQRSNPLRLPRFARNDVVES